MLVPEPENAYDRSAVAINLLDGTSLGFIRKEDQAEYSRARLHEKEQIRFGRVSASGAFSPTPYSTVHYARVRVPSPHAARVSCQHPGGGDGGSLHGRHP